MKFYSPSTHGFYDPEMHGVRVISIMQPGWVRPTTSVTLQPGESIAVEVDGDLRQVTNDTDAPTELTGVSDMSVMPPMIDIPNPDCTIPADAVEISEDEYTSLLATQSTGYSIGPDASGRPIAVAPPPESGESILARALVEIRKQRAPILDALNGVASRAARAGDATTAAAADQAAIDLLDITSLPSLLTAATHDDMKAAVLARYREIASTAPAQVQSAFNEAFAS